MLILSRPLDESEDNQYNSVKSNRKKIMKAIYFPLFSFIFLTGIIVSLRFLLTLTANSHTSNRLLLSNNDIDQEDNYNNQSDYKLKTHFFSKINRAVYSGNWSSESSQVEMNNNHSLIYMQINTNRNNRPNALCIIVRSIYGVYATQWKETQIKADFNSIALSNTSNSFAIKGKEDILATTESNEGSQMYDKAIDCNISFQLTFTGNPSNNNVEKYDHVTGALVSKCQIDLSFELKIEEPLSDFNVITFYSAAISFLCLCSLANTIWLNVTISDSESYANSICLFTIYLNVIWNSFGCLSHFFFTLNSIQYFIQFLIPTVLYFTNFAIADLNLLYSLWRLKYSRIISNPLLIKRKLIELYCLFYVILFIALFLVNKFYFSKGYIIVGVILTWVPQIIYNAYYKNNISMPFVSILIISVCRLFFPCYCRGYRGNFFLIEPDYVYVTLCVFIALCLITLMYSQMAFGSRWFVPKRLATEAWEYYKTMEELIRVKKDVDKIECVICLNPLIDNNDNAKYFPNEFIIPEANDKYIQGDSEIALFQKPFSLNMFSFQKKNSNPTNKQFMLTQCDHAFHSVCLESWFIRKKECPNCRKELAFG